MVKLLSSDLVEKGKKLLLDGKPDEAANHFNFLYNNNPESYEYPYYLGCSYQKKDLDGLAIACFKDAVAKFNDFPEAWSNMGACYFKLQERDLARECWEVAVSLTEKEAFYLNRPKEEADKQKAEFLVNLGSAYVANGTPADALTILDEAQRVLPTDNGHWNRALALLELGRYEEGWQEYDYGERVNGANDRSYSPPKAPKTPIWDGTKGKTLVVYGEQGIGDELMFATVLPDVIKDCNVIIEAHPRLANMFRNSFPGIPVYGTRKDKRISWPTWSCVEAKVSIGSLCKFYRNKWEDFPGTPYIIPDPELVRIYKERFTIMGNKPKIGISWKGGIKKTGKNHRIIPMDMLKTLFELDADFISLQYDENAQHEVDKFNEATGLVIHHWPFIIDHYDHTAAMIKSLDMIISVPQSVVHLAGSIGVPTIQLCPKKALWQMGVYGHNMPWYNSVINIWQEKEGDWSMPLEKAKQYFLATREDDARENDAEPDNARIQTAE